MSKKKYYVVWEGIEEGIFESWEECKALVDGVKQAKYKSFSTYEEAQKAFYADYKKYVYAQKNEKDQLEDARFEGTTPDFNSIVVDASCSGNPGTMHYRGVDMQTGKVIFSQGPFYKSTNNIGEFLAIVHALALLKKNNENKVVYSDSRIAINWVKAKKCKTTLEYSDKNKDSFELISRAEKWLEESSFSTQVLKWQTKIWGEIPADYGKK